MYSYPIVNFSIEINYVWLPMKSSSQTTEKNWKINISSCSSVKEQIIKLMVKIDAESSNEVAERI